MIAGFHSILYPTLKFNDNWFVTGAVQLVTRPYYFEQFSAIGSGANGNLRNPDLDPDLSIDQEKGMNWLGCASVAAGATLILRCRSYNFQFFLQM